jgi:hypothetical protein
VLLEQVFYLIGSSQEITKALSKKVKVQVGGLEEAMVLVGAVGALVVLAEGDLVGVAPEGAGKKKIIFFIFRVEI